MKIEEEKGEMMDERKRNTGRNLVYGMRRKEKRDDDSIGRGQRDRKECITVEEEEREEKEEKRNYEEREGVR